MANITILQSQSADAATKTFKRLPDGRLAVTGYDAGKFFAWRTAEVDSIQSLTTLAQLLEEFSNYFMVRAEVIPAFRGRRTITRTLYDNPAERQIAMLQTIPEGVQWAMLDFDAIALPPGMTPLEGVELLISRLPAEFQNVSYGYQLSSSAGVVGVSLPDATGKTKTYQGWATISVHVFFWFTQPVQKIARWAKNLNATVIAAGGDRVVDTATLNDVQPNYTAIPKFVGMADPVVDAGYARSGFVQKDCDSVELVWIDPPVKFVRIDGQDVKVKTIIRRDGEQLYATPSLGDHIAAIGVGNEYRQPLMHAIGYYFWYHGTAGSEAEIIDLLRAAFPGGIKDYLTDKKINDMVGWFSSRATHPPVYQDRKDNEALTARLVAWRDNRPPLPDDQPETDYEDWIFDLEDYGLTFYYMDGECGVGKTEKLVADIGNDPDRRVICLPRIDLIREVYERLESKYPNIEQAKNYVIKTIYTHRDGDVRDAEDEADIHSANNVTVGEQIAVCRGQIKGHRHVVVFITHAALLLTDWSAWGGFHLIIDEVPDPYQTYSLDFRNTAEWVQRYIQISGAETNYYRLCLTAAGAEKVKSGRFDYNEAPIRAVLESLALPNANVYALRTAWDDMANQKVQLMRLTDPGFLRPFKSVTMMGDEFTQSTLALAFSNKYNVEWQPHPNQPTRQRSVPLKDRVRLFFFATKADRRASVTSYTEGKLIPKLLRWFDDPANDPGQTLITTNRRFEHHFPKPKTRQFDVATPSGMIQRTLVQQNDIRRLWVPPKLAGTDIYKDMTNVAWFAALRPGADEQAFVTHSLLISAEQQIRWREYNSMYQFVMRVCPRQYDSDKVCNVYVFDEYEAEYLRDRFGGCLEFTHVPGVINETKRKAGRPKLPDGKASSVLERKRAQRAREKEALEATQSPGEESDVARRMRLLRLKRLSPNLL